MKIKLIKWWNNIAPNTVVGVSDARARAMVQDGIAMDVDQPDVEMIQPDPDAKTSEPVPEERVDKPEAEAIATPDSDGGGNKTPEGKRESILNRQFSTEE